MALVSSMTGFGRASVEIDNREMTVELKSVNHRYLDIGFRLPRYLGFLEDVIRRELSASLTRGHVDVFINYKNNRSDAKSVSVDMALLTAYLEAAREAGSVAGLDDDITLSAALKLPDVTSINEADEDMDAVSALAVAALNEAVKGLKAMRIREGQTLAADMLARAELIKDIAARISLRAPEVVKEYKQKLTDRISELLEKTPVDESRIAMEVAIFADKASIDEELVRLSSHVEQLKHMLNGDDAAGRKLDFIVQEMNREFNTIGSKANDAEIVKCVIEGKGEIEKLREQVQNIE